MVRRLGYKLPLTFAGFLHFPLRWAVLTPRPSVLPLTLNNQHPGGYDRQTRVLTTEAGARGGWFARPGSCQTAACRSKSCPPTGFCKVLLERKCVIYVQWNIIQPLERRKPCHLQQEDEPWGHHAKWNNSERERKILHYITYICNFFFFFKLNL